MANEIYASLSIKARKGGAETSFSGSYNLTMTGNEMIGATQLVGTTSELLTLGDISGAPGAIVIKNMDSTNFVTIGGDSSLTVFSLKVMPGEFAFIRATSGTIYVKADTAAVRIQKLATEA